MNIERMDLWCPPEDLISDVSSAIHRYRMAHSRQYAELRAEREAVGKSLEEVRREFAAPYHDYETGVGAYQNAVTCHFWARGAYMAAMSVPVPQVMAAAVTRRQDIPLPTALIETAECLAHAAFASLWRMLPSEDERTALQAHFDLLQKDIWATVPYALLHGYEWMLAILEIIGVGTANPDDLKTAYLSLK